jgi:glycosyltransferase involved in cell wall biosynthesis
MNYGILPKISVVTPSFNQGIYIRDTVESVLRQNYPDFEHIVIDNCSTDNTREILSEYPHLKIISEKDNGPADAINKGMNIAEGVICAWLNSDDYYEENVFKEIAGIFKDTGADILTGNITFIYPEKNNHKDRVKVKPYELDKLIHDSSDSVRQAGIFFSRELFHKTGGLNNSLKLVFDYDLLIRMLQVGNQVYIDKNIAYQRMYKGTMSKKYIRNQAMEVFRVSRHYGARLNDPIIMKSVVRKYLFPWMY